MQLTLNYLGSNIQQWHASTGERCNARKYDDVHAKLSGQVHINNLFHKEMLPKAVSNDIGFMQRCVLFWLLVKENYLRDLQN